MRKLLCLVTLAAFVGCESPRDQFLRESAILKELEASWVEARMESKQEQKHIENFNFGIAEAKRGRPLIIDGEKLTVDSLAKDVADATSRKMAADAEVDRLTPVITKQKAVVDQLQKSL